MHYILSTPQSHRRQLIINHSVFGSHCRPRIQAGYLLPAIEFVARLFAMPHIPAHPRTRADHTPRSKLGREKGLQTPPPCGCDRRFCDQPYRVPAMVRSLLAPEPVAAIRATPEVARPFRLHTCSTTDRRRLSVLLHARRAAASARGLRVDIAAQRAVRRFDNKNAAPAQIN